MAQIVDPNSLYTSAGTPTRRSDAPDKLTGRTRFAGDLTFPDLLRARLVLSPYAHARILAIDIAAALAIPGVVAVYTSETIGLNLHGSSRTQTPLAHEEVFWCGHPVALVLGESDAAAEDGAAAVDVDYEPLPVVLDPIAAMQPDSPITRPRHQGEASEIAGGGAHAEVAAAQEPEDESEVFSLNVSDKAAFHYGDIEAGWREADVVVEHTYHTRPVHQSYMETQSITVVPSPSGHELTIWPSTQGLLGVRSEIAEALAMPARQIHVESVPIGGAFGGKFGLYESLIAAAARAIRKPVRLVYTRQEDLLAGNPAPQTVISVKLGARHDGTLVALQSKAIFDAGAYPGASAGLGVLLLHSSYRCPNMSIQGYEVLTNKVSVGAYRAPNAPQVTFALESTVHELCEKLDIDPIAFRKLNALREGDPMHNPRRPHWPAIGLLECLEKIEQQPLWINRAHYKTPPTELRGWKIGIGLAAGGWPGGTDTAAASCRLERDGTVTVVIGTVDLTGSDTTMELLTAEGLGIPAALVHVTHGNTDTMPYSGGTGGSKTTYVMGPAVLAAAREARTQILDIASEMLEASVEDLDIEQGQVVVKGVPGKGVSLKEIAMVSMRLGGRFAPVYGHGRAAVHASAPMYATHLARIALDPDTGEVRVLDYVVAQDVGHAINPAEVEGQIQGGVTQGLGWALFEGFEYDENGQLLTSTLMDYALPHSKDVPNITTLLVEIPSASGPLGAKGVGEPPVVPVAAAIANAIADAVAVRMTQLPMTPERIFTALHSTR